MEMTTHQMAEKIRKNPDWWLVYGYVPVWGPFFDYAIDDKEVILVFCFKIGGKDVGFREGTARPAE